MNEARSDRPTVLILGAGINGCSVARELALNDVNVVLADAYDIAYGATSKSSRLVHGGLRYLEYGETDLVKESLEERGRLLRLAPQFVRPLRLFIPLRDQFTGLLSAAGRFLGVSNAPSKGRGLWLVQIGLELYDLYAQDKSVPKHHMHRITEPDVPDVDTLEFHWLCSYYDAQMVYPERFVLALLADAKKIAADNDVSLDVLTYHRTRFEGKTAIVEPLIGNGVERRFEPDAIVNASGAWGDATLKEISVPSPQLFAGTKGSHFLTHQQKLVDALHGEAIYAEAADGRLVFILPIDARSVMVGTTDIPFTGDPGSATATPEEIDYLIELVDGIFPQCGLTRADVAMHWAGVRPLPKSGDAKNPAATTRRHWVDVNEKGPVPVLTLVGGKLTVGRSLAEHTVRDLLTRWKLEAKANSEERVVPGGENYPAHPTGRAAEQQRLANRLAFPVEAIRMMWELVGTRVGSILAAATNRRLLDGTNVPIAFAQWVVQNEWVETLEDLVERRLMLLYEPNLTDACLRQLATLLADAGRISSAQIDEKIAAVRDRLHKHYGKRSPG